MTKITTWIIAIFLMALPVFPTGCSGGNKPGTDAKTDMAHIKSNLKKAQRTRNPKTRINLLRSAYDNAEQLTARWPDSEKVPVFLKKYGEQLGCAPGQVYELSMQERDMESFKWAFARSSKDYTQHSELLKVWQMGKQWRDYFVSKYPEETLSIFMNEAVNAYSIRFFNQYIGDFKASGYRLEFPLEKTEFNARFCRFFAEMIKTAMQKEDMERIGFLLDHMPTYGSVIYIDLKTEETMKTLGEYVCHELKDEAMACKLVGLGYDMNRIDFSKTGFGTDFVKALEANPEYALAHVLKLNEWHGALSEEETVLLLTLPDPLLRSVHKLHIAEAIGTSIKNANNEDALRLIKLREEIQPLTSHDYDQLLGWSLEYRNRSIFDYVKTKCTEIDIYQLDLVQLAENRNLFRLYAPEILKRIYRTMDKKPRNDGTTFGRIHDLLVSNNPEAVLYLVKNHDFGDTWTETTEGRTLLMDVCEGGNLEAAKYLIENKGADVHAQTGYIEVRTSLFGRAKSKEGNLSPIFFAAKSGNSELIEYLASKRANVNARSGFRATPLMYAVSNNHLEATKTLISLGANVNAVMDGNLTPTDLAELGVYTEISTAYRRARKNGNKEILDVLKKAGARP